MTEPTAVMVPIASQSEAIRAIMSVDSPHNKSRRSHGRDGPDHLAQLGLKAVKGQRKAVKGQRKAVKGQRKAVCLHLPAGWDRAPSQPAAGRGVHRHLLARVSLQLQ